MYLYFTKYFNKVLLTQNTSVLENHHWRSAVSCLIESGLLDQMQESRAQLENQISSLILATDITRQQEYLSQFKVSRSVFFIQRDFL